MNITNYALKFPYIVLVFAALKNQNLEVELGGRGSLANGVMVQAVTRIYRNTIGYKPSFILNCMDEILFFS